MEGLSKEMNYWVSLSQQTVDNVGFRSAFKKLESDSLDKMEHKVRWEQMGTKNFQLLIARALRKYSKFYFMFKI